jgi:hypothetical protein
MKVYRVKYSSRSGGHKGWSMCDSPAEAKQRIMDLKARGYRAFIADIEDREDWSPKVEEVTVAYRARH